MEAGGRGRRNRAPWLPVLGAIGLAMVIWFGALAANRGEERTVDPVRIEVMDSTDVDRADTRQAEVPILPDTVAVEYAEPVRPPSGFFDQPASVNSDEVRLAADGVLDLVNALDAVMATRTIRDVELDAARADLELRVERIRTDTTLHTDSERMRDVLIIATDLIGRIQEERHPEFQDRVDELREIVIEMPDQDFEGSAGSLQTFFEQAGDLVRDMDDNSSDLAIR